MRFTVTVIACALTLGACGKQYAPAPAPASAAPAITAGADGKRDPVQDAARFTEWFRTDRAAVAREISAHEYRLQRRLLDFSGLTDDLGGAERADQALRALMQEVEAGSLPPVTEWKRVSDVQVTSGTFAVGQAVMEVTPIMLGMDKTYGDGKPSTSITTQNQANAELNSGNGTISFVSEKEFSANGLNAHFLTNLKINPCPDVTGLITLELVAKVNVSGVSGKGSNTEFKVTATRQLDDDANMGDLEYRQHVETASFGGGSGSFVDLDDVISTRTGEMGTKINRRSSKTTDADVAEVEMLARLLQVVAIGYLEFTRSVWEGGKCVRIDTETTPAQRSHVKPATNFRINGSPRSTVDGSFVGGTVRGMLQGASALDPGATKVRADATFSYVAPGERDKQATVSLEARSKRGIGLASLGFDTNTARGYQMEGGAKELHFKGQVCDIEDTFFLESDTENTRVTLRFEPESHDGGRYSYSGTMTGYDDKGKKYTFPVHGKGEYVLKRDGEVPVGIDAHGPGTVETPYGPVSDEGKEKYTLKPLGDEPCAGAS